MRHSLHIFRIALALLLLPGVLTVTARAQKPRQPQRYAVLVGINEYDHGQRLPRLRYAVNDAVEMAKLLVQHGYDVTLLTDKRPDGLDLRIRYYSPERKNIVEALRVATAQFRKGDTLLVALSGHGLQFEGDSAAYFCPRDAVADKERPDTLLSIRDDFYKRMELIHDGFKILLVDACRNDPKNTSRGVTADDVPPSKGVWAYFSCKKGELAAESADLKHGVFFYSVLQVLRGEVGRDSDGWVRAGRLTDNVPKLVRRLAPDRSQTPNVKTDWEGDAPEFVRLTSAAPLPPVIAPRQEPLPPVGQAFTRTFSTARKTVAEQELVRVRLPNGQHVFVGTHEVSQKLFEVVTGSNPSKYKNGSVHVPSNDDRDLAPVEHVTFREAEEFYKRLSPLDPQFNYRMPTADEMRFFLNDGKSDEGQRAAPAPQVFARTSDDLEKHVNHRKPNETAFPRKVKCAGVSKWCVEVSPNLKLHHILGNVAEWCRDGDGFYYAVGGSIDSSDEEFYKGRVLPGERTRVKAEDLRRLIGIRVVAEPKAP